MKHLKHGLLLAFVFMTAAVKAQTGPVVTFLDYNEKKSSSTNSGYYVVTTKKDPSDIYWDRILYYNDTIQGFIAAKGKSSDEKGLLREGPFVYFHKNGTKWKEGVFTNNKEEGEWKTWDEEGKPESVNHYTAGSLTGKNISWFSNGRLKDSTMLDEKGNGTGTEFYKEGQQKAAGNYVNGEKQGHWLYYFKDEKNQPCSDVVFEKDSAVSIICYTEDGKVQKKDCVLEREAKFPGGDEGWRKYLVKKLTAQFDSYAKLMKSNQVYSTIVKFAINHDGELFDIRVETPQNAKLDGIAVSIIKESPAWIPAVQYNFKVNAYRRQPITFVTTD
ncbi:MAG: hypothetical protein U0V75_06695 [Ferruginibacter sp.]